MGGIPVSWQYQVLWEIREKSISNFYNAINSTHFSCFIIEAHPDNINTVYGHLKVNPDFKGDIDYEEYEVIYLAIRVTDRNQEVNPDSADGNGH